MGEMTFSSAKGLDENFRMPDDYHDSDRILASLKNLNFTKTDDVQDADLVLFNTCAVRDLANQKFYSQLGK